MASLLLGWPPTVSLLRLIFSRRMEVWRVPLQDGFAQIMVPDFDAGWEVLGNSFKPYACLHGIHPAVDAARQLAPQIGAVEIKK